MTTHRRLPLAVWPALTALVLSALVVLAGPPPASGAPTLPPGFALREIRTGQAAFDLTSFAYLPDDSLLTIGKSGRVTWVSAGGTTVRTLARLNTVTTRDLGLIGIAVAPDYSRTNHIYLARSVPSTSPFRLRLSRFTVSGGSSPTGLTNEKVLLQLRSPAAIHGMTDIVVAGDGTLWVSIGDLQYAVLVPQALKALDLDEPAGKLLHLTPAGAGVPTNPYYNPARPRSWRSRVYASGFRSPFRLSLDPLTGAPVVGDVGWNTWEEVDRVRPGASYRWPCWEGPAQTPGYQDMPECAGVPNTSPLWSYHHGAGSAQGNAVTGGIVYVGNTYPAAYQDAYFFGDYVGNKVWTMRFDAAGGLVSRPQDPPFATDIGGPVKFGTAPNGDIVFADIISGTLRRLSYSPGNRPPTASATTRTEPATRTVTFDARGSTDLDGDPLTYAWTFGDGASAQGRRVSHTYAGRGATFTARLTVTDPLGASGTRSLTVAPSNHTPTLSLATPSRTRFAVGDPIELSAKGQDAEDGALRVRWTTALVHCSETATCHRHPGDARTGPRWLGRFPEHPDTSLEVTASVRDSVGVRTWRTFVARPRQHRITLVSSVPAVLQIAEKPGVRTAMVTQGVTLHISAARRATDRFSRFYRWSDGSASRARALTIGRRDLTLHATYLTPIGRRYAESPGLRQALGRPVGPEEVSGPLRQRRYERGRLYWTADTGVHRLSGPVLRKYRSAGGFAELGAPTMDVRSTRDGRGRYADLSKNASVYWSRATGAHEVHGKIRRRWVEMGRERSFLGFPTSDVAAVPGGWLSAFEGGSIRWIAATGETRVRRG